MAINTGMAPKALWGERMPLTAAKRREIPASEKGLPGHGKGPGGSGPGDYPLDTAKRARSALSRASANATPSEQATIKRKVHKLYPGIKQEAQHNDGGCAHHAGGACAY